MRRFSAPAHLLIVFASAASAACSSAAAPSAPGSPRAPQPATEAPSSADAEPVVADEGIFELYLNDQLLRTEKFRVARTETGWQIEFAIETDSRTAAEGWLSTDLEFAPKAGAMVQTWPDGDELSSTLRLDPEGYLVATMDDGTDQRATRAHQKAIDLYISGRITSLVWPLCQIEPKEATTRVVFPGTTVQLSKQRRLPLADGSRRVVTRSLSYPESGKRVILACERGWLVGEYSPRSTAVLVRRGETELAAALRQLE